MTIWTPHQAVKVKVLGLPWLGQQVLLGEVEDSAGRVKGLRPLGGSVEFGETREQALHREFMEELGWVIEIAGPWHALENIYEHEGATGHEYVFVANIRLEGQAPDPAHRIRYNEADGVPCHAGWFLPDALPAGVSLYPDGLSGLIVEGMIASPAR